MVLVSVLRHLFGRSNSESSRNGATDGDDMARACALYDAGDINGAREAAKGIVSRNPGNGNAHYLLGRWYGESGDLERALACLVRAVALAPGSTDAHMALGNVYKLKGDAPHAIESYRAALRIDPNAGAAHYNLAVTLKAVGDRESALRHLHIACEQSPMLAAARSELILLCVNLRRYDEAQRALEAATALHAGAAWLIACRGFLLLKTHRAQEALACFEEAARLGGADYELYNNMGIALQHLGRMDEALAAYDRSLSLRPGYELPRFHRALAQLALHQFDRGWDDYELRLITADRPPMVQHFPRWTGQALEGRSILVYGEQGLGDEIMFASCYPQLLKQSEHTVLWCSRKLERLFKRSFPRAEVYGVDLSNPAQARPERALDFQLPAGSLPFYMRRSLADFPQHRGYLAADAGRTAYWRDRLSALGPGPKIGISWQGGTYDTRQPLRSLPLSAWLPIFRQPAHFVSLQYGDSQAALSRVENDHGIHVVHWQDAIDDYDETAALVSALDLVVSVCTAVIHLAGALGQNVWIMAPLSPEWRYGYVGDSMPWYPSARIFRQAVLGEWEPVMERVARELQIHAGAFALSREGSHEL